MDTPPTDDAGRLDWKLDVATTPVDLVTKQPDDTADRHRAAYGAYAYLTELAYTLDADPAFATMPRDRWPESWAAIDAACKALYHAALTIRRERDGATRRPPAPGLLATLRRVLGRGTP